MHESPATEYVIEFSHNGSDFSHLTTISGTGNSYSSYSYRHQLTAPGSHYFRVRAVDMEGRSVLSDVISVNNNCRIPFNISLFPNPADRDLNIRIKTPSEGKSSIIIMNETGQMVYRNEFTLMAGTNNIKIDTEKFPAGAYLLRAESSGGSNTLRFVKGR